MWFGRLSKNAVGARTSIPQNFDCSTSSVGRDAEAVEKLGFCFEVVRATRPLATIVHRLFFADESSASHFSTASARAPANPIQFFAFLDSLAGYSAAADGSAPGLRRGRVVRTTF